MVEKLFGEDGNVKDAHLVTRTVRSVTGSICPPVTTTMLLLLLLMLLPRLLHVLHYVQLGVVCLDLLNVRLRLYLAVGRVSSRLLLLLLLFKCFWFFF